MNPLVDPSQTVIIQGRYILDNMVVAHEIIHHTKQKKIK
jgi:hypothetical protein